MIHDWGVKITSSKLNRYGFLWVTTGFFVISLAGHWLFAWPAYVQDQEEHQQPVEMKGFFQQTARDTLENWQSEFLQLMWQVAGLAYLLYLGSPQSKEGDDRKEEKLDALLKMADREKGAELIEKIDRKYPRS
jgi:hypothetical protein